MVNRHVLGNFSWLAWMNVTICCLPGRIEGTPRSYLLNECLRFARPRGGGQGAQPEGEGVRTPALEPNHDFSRFINVTFLGILNFEHTQLF